MKEIRKLGCVMLVLSFVCLYLSSAALAGNEVKVTGTVVTGAADPEGKLAPLMIQGDKETYAVVNNAVAQKISKKVGKKLDITGTVAEVGGKKVLTPWIFVESGVKVKAQPTG